MMKLSCLPRSPITGNKSGSQQAYCGAILAIIALILFTSGCNESGLTELSDSLIINSTNPSSDEIDIPVNTSINAIFNKQLNPSSIHENSFQVFEDTSAVTGTIDCNDSTATFIPSRNFSENTRITVRISADVADIDGNRMNEEYEWSFFTGEESTVPRPVITATNPSNGASEIPVTSAVMATFNDAMDASTVNTATFLLRLGSTNIAGEVNYADQKAVFGPNGNLQKGQTYRATVTDEVRNQHGQPLSENYNWQFTTEEEDADEKPPQVNATNPGDGENNVPVNSTVSATFSEQIDPSTISAETFTLSENGDRIDGDVQYSNRTATFNPSSNLQYGSTYRAQISTEVEDLAGNQLEESHQWTFRTEEPEDNSPPEVVETDPEDDEEEVSRDVTITAEFNEPLDPATVNDETVILERERFFFGPERVGIEVSYSDNVISINPNGRLRKEEDYTVRLTTGITDAAGNALRNEYEWEFETDDDDDDDDD